MYHNWGTLPSPVDVRRVLAALSGRLRRIVGAAVKRNEALPAAVPTGGLIILRDGDPGEPDVTLNPRTEFFSHRAEIEVFVTQPASGGGEAVLDDLLSRIAAALTADRSLAENLFCSAPETSVLAIEGAAPILAARLTITIEYLVSDPLAA